MTDSSSSNKTDQDDCLVPQETMAAAEQLRTELAAANHIVAFTGAGISTESGIPDFRSPGGMWKKFKPIDFSEFIASADVRAEAWRRKAGTRGTIGSAQPNAGHLALVALAEASKLRSVITQNVDGLHQVSGLNDDQVIELHGNATYATCLACHKRFDIDLLLDQFEQTQEAPECAACGGIVKSATISFGQAMPILPMERAEAASLACDLFIVLGTSLVVYPAAGFPRLAKAHGARLVIVNREPTDQDSLADLVIHQGIGEVLRAAVEAL